MKHNEIKLITRVLGFAGEQTNVYGLLINIRPIVFKREKNVVVQITNQTVTMEFATYR